MGVGKQYRGAREHGSKGGRVIDRGPGWPGLVPGGLFFALGVTGVLGLSALPEGPFWSQGWAWILPAGGWLVLVSLPGNVRPVRLELRAALLGLACLILGIGWGVWRAHERMGDGLDPALEGRGLVLVGVVAEMPGLSPRGYRFPLAVESAFLVPEDGARGRGGCGAGAPELGIGRVPSRVMLSWWSSGFAPGTQGSMEDSFGAPGEDGGMIRAGERWCFTVRLKQPHGTANPDLFDYEAWLLERGIRATGYVRGRGQRLAPWVPGLAQGVERLRQGVRDRFMGALPTADYPYGGILAALAIGDQRVIPGDQWRVFSRTGVVHLLSVSGLHVTMVAALVGWSFGWGWRRFPPLMARFPAQRAALAAGWLGALAYTLLSGAAVPAQRTLYMLSVAILALLLGRGTRPFRVWVLALVVVLILDPWAPLGIGFWLSFGAVGMLLWLSDGQLRLGQQRAAPLGQRALAGLREWGWAQWGVTLGGLPLLLMGFQQVSLVSPLANAVAIPWVSAVITPLVLLAVIFPLDALLHLAHALLAPLMIGLQGLSAWSGAVMTLPAPSLVQVCLGSVGALWMLLPRGVPGRWLGALLILPLLWGSAPRPPPGRAWVDILDVGQGLAVVIRSPGHTLLYDTGPYYSPESDAGDRIVVPFLRAQGISAVDMMVVTHQDKDHAGGARSVLESLPVRAVVDSLPEQAWLSRDGIPRERCLTGMAWEWEGVSFRFVHPADEVYATPQAPNHRSCVLRVAVGEDVLLLAADAEASDESAMLARQEPLAAQALVVPHHGSGTSSSPPWVAAVGAREVFISAGYRNRFRHPKAEVVARYEASGARIWRTDRQGALHGELGAGQPGDGAWQSFRETVPRYWRRGALGSPP